MLDHARPRALLSSMRLSSTSDILVTAWTAKLMEQELHDNVGVAVNESVALSPTLGRNLSEGHLRNLVKHRVH